LKDAQTLTAGRNVLPFPKNEATSSGSTKTMQIATKEEDYRWEK
jgi:hypothetical protein